MKDTEICYIMLARRDKDGESSLSLRGYAVYSYLVQQSLYDCGANNSQISARTGLDRSGVADVLDELRAVELVWTSDEQDKQLINEPTPEQWNNLFDRNACEHFPQWQKRFKYVQTFIRKIGSEITFNQSVVYSLLVSLSKATQFDYREVQSTNFTGLAKWTGLCHRTISKNIEDLQSLNLIFTGNTTAKSFSVVVPDLTDETSKFFLHKGQANTTVEDLSIALSAYEAFKAGKKPAPVDAPVESPVDGTLEEVEDFYSTSSDSTYAPEYETNDRHVTAQRLEANKQAIIREGNKKTQWQIDNADELMQISEGGKHD
jgi:hypothetical protein